MSHALSPRRTAVLTAAAAALAAAALAGPALAGSYEQIDRGNDRAGYSPLFSLTVPFATSDNGRHALFASFNSQKDTALFGLRDTVRNHTTLVDLAGVSPFGYDQAESQLLASRTNASGATEVILIPKDGGPARVLLTITDELYTPLSASISGDGKTVVVGAYPLGTKRIDVPSGQVTELSSDAWRVGPRSISDDGAVIVADRYQDSVLLNGTTETSVPAAAVLSPDGSTVAAIDYGTGALVTQDVATGQVKTTPMPHPYYQRIAWIAEDGSQVAIGSEDSYSEPGTTMEAKVLTVATGTWATFGGPYAEHLHEANIQNPEAPGLNLISRNGKYAVLTYTANPFRFPPANHAALVNLSGGDLPGTQESLSASSYVGVGSTAKSCVPEDPDNPRPAPTISLRFAQPAPWLPKPRRAVVTFAFDKGGAVTKTFASAQQATDSVESLTQIPIPAAATKVTVLAGVIDPAGKYVFTSESSPITCSPFGW